MSHVVQFQTIVGSSQFNKKIKYNTIKRNQQKDTKVDRNKMVNYANSKAQKGLYAHSESLGEEPVLQDCLDCRGNFIPEADSYLERHV